ncbi:hypothetical protein [Algoriphagus sp. AK58]|uniref:hypothetical protein n=1 Tax=Algoriphagus sp. AK58 TaxID=1406877 RepID=UPI00164F2020|nr:hypothetical protein [Algoriphagus sp. AK58]MBC6365805.1 hypothetical protein [Algoriphagus sp. AK58]
MEEQINKIKELPSILGELKELVFERIRNPFLASFSFFWIIINWKIPFYLIASNKEVEERFEFVSLNYSSIYYTLLMPLVLAIGYLYLKDIIFNFLEKTTNNFFIKRKETETDKAVELIKLEVRKVDALNELKDAQERNKLAQSLKDCESKYNELKKTVSKLTTDKVNSEKMVDSLRKTIEYDFQFDLIDEKIQRFLNEKSETEIQTLGIKLSQLLTEFEMFANEEIKSIINELTKEELGYFRLNSDGKLVDVELFSTGKFALRYYIYSNSNFIPLKLNLKKRENRI